MTHPESTRLVTLTVLCNWDEMGEVEFPLILILSDESLALQIQQ
jgi:hypothetical protein